MTFYTLPMLEAIIATKRSIAIVGAGMVGKKFYYELSSDSRDKVVAFIDNADELSGSSIGDVGIFKPGTVTADIYVIAIGNDEVKEILYRQLESIGISKSRIFIYAYPHSPAYYTTYAKTFEWKHCPICNSNDFYIVQDDIAKCQQCNHGFRLHVPDKILPHYYDKSYWNQDKNRNGMYDVEPGKDWDNWLGERMELLEHFKLLSHDDPTKINVLEFGCAEGMILYELKKRGYNVMGNDICAIAEESKNRLGVDISRLPVEDFSKLGMKYHLIMSFHVMEHLHDPLSVMENLSHMLMPNGIMLLHVPIDDQEFDNKDHFHFFTDKSCRVLMEKFTKNIQSDCSAYPIGKGINALAATYVGEQALI
ncbi:MAG: methyltransferase domain-containing protein [Selenomonadaceae bacterium]|nr:methyltransferase domain-containing protein [Selenomonadaceae bacterium]